MKKIDTKQIPTNINPAKRPSKEDNSFSHSVSERKIVGCKDPMVCLRGCSVRNQTCKCPIYGR